MSHRKKSNIGKNRATMSSALLKLEALKKAKAKQEEEKKKKYKQQKEESKKIQIDLDSSGSQSRSVQVSMSASGSQLASSGSASDDDDDSASSSGSGDNSHAYSESESESTPRTSSSSSSSSSHRKRHKKHKSKSRARSESSDDLSIEKKSSPSGITSPAPVGGQNSAGKHEERPVEVERVPRSPPAKKSKPQPAPEPKPRDPSPERARENGQHEPAVLDASKKYIDEKQEKLGVVNSEFLYAESLKPANNSTTLDLARYMKTSAAHFDSVVYSLALDYAKVEKPSDPQLLATKFIESQDPGVKALTFDARDPSKRSAELRALGVTLWGQKGIPIPPAVGPSEDRLLDTEPITKDTVKELIDEDELSGSVTSETVEQYQSNIAEQRAKAVALNEKRKEQFEALSPEQRSANEIDRSVVLREVAVTSIPVEKLLPYVSCKKLPVECAVLYYTKGKNNAMTFVDDSNCKHFYSANVVKQVILHRSLIPSDARLKKKRMPILDSLSLARYVKKCISLGLKSKHGYTSEQAKNAATSVGETFYFNDPTETKLRVIKAAFGIDVPAEWVESKVNDNWLANKLVEPNRADLRKASRSKDAANLHSSVDSLFKDAELKIATVDTDGEPEAKAVKRAAPIKRKAPSAVSTTSPPKKEAPVPELDSDTKKLIESLKKDPEKVVEARIPRDLFFIDIEKVPMPVFDQLGQVIGEVADVADRNARVRTAQKAVDTFSVATQEQNTTSTQRKDEEETLEEEDVSDDFMRDDYRFRDKICASLGIPTTTFTLALMRKFAPAIAAEVERDVPDLVRPTDEEVALMVKEAVKLRHSSRSGVKTTRRSQLTYHASRVVKPAQGRLTSPKSERASIGNIQKAPAPHEDTFASANVYKSWLLLMTEVDSLDGATGDIMKYGELMTLRDALRKGAEFTLEQRLRILITEAMMPIYMEYTIVQMQKLGKLFSSTDYAEAGDDLLRTMRRTTEPGSGFPTWLAHCSLMQIALASLARIARSKINQTDARSQLTMISDADRQFSPVVMWTPNQNELTGRTTYTDEMIKPAVDAFFGISKE